MAEEPLSESWGASNDEGRAHLLGLLRSLRRGAHRVATGIGCLRGAHRVATGIGCLRGAHRVATGIGGPPAPGVAGVAGAWEPTSAVANGHLGVLRSLST
jgi:hypothetical protein